MHLFRILPVLSLLFGAQASHVDVREPAPHPLDIRATLDVCANVNTALQVTILGKVVTVGHISVCLCLSTIHQFLGTNLVAIAAVALVGADEVTDILTTLVVNAAASSNCVYPDHSIPTCVNGNTNPCAFQCTDGFTPDTLVHPTKCVCKAPSVVCNGKCVAPGACPSQKPSVGRKRWVGSGSCAEMGPGWAACGVFGGAARAWECVHIARDLESCGGCVLPLTAYSPLGKDCTAIPGVADVICLSGKCVVRRCLRGYTLGLDGTSCHPEHPSISQPDVTGMEEEIELAPARIFGLEHIPLERN